LQKRRKGWKVDCELDQRKIVENLSVLKDRNRVELEFFGMILELREKLGLDDVGVAVTIEVNLGQQRLDGIFELKVNCPCWL